MQECIAVTEPIVIPEEEKILPEDARNVDTDPDPFALSEYAESIFRNMKACEVSTKMHFFPNKLP